MNDINLQTSLLAISPLDGRYSRLTQPLKTVASEYGFIYYRLIVEIYWFIHLSDEPSLPELPPLTGEAKTWLHDLINNFDLSAAKKIKSIEAVTHHDVKAIEYYLAERFQEREDLKPYISFIHFGCTSEDINNVAYALMLLNIKKTLIPYLDAIWSQFETQAQLLCQQPMLARTHGQAASPTTVGKEFRVFVERTRELDQQFKHLPIKAKFNGAVGNYHAHLAAYPTIDWLKITQRFIENLGFNFNPYTTQIEPHDNLVTHLYLIRHINTILVDFCRDMWGYISNNYFVQQASDGEVGSSTMPHKINPIDFENAEGNLGLSNALLQYFIDKLPISRWQRDLTDSTTLRNLGSCFGYALIAYQNLSKGLSKLTVNSSQLHEDLNKQWSVLAEPIQTVLRKYQIPQAYETLKALTRGHVVTQQDFQIFIANLAIPEDAKKALLTLSPETYLGLAIDITNLPLTFSSHE